jgi:hypothetical protein
MSLSIEKLNRLERSRLEVGDYAPTDGPKALHIIDAQAAVIERVRIAYESRGSNGAFGWQFERAIGDALAAAPEQTKPEHGVRASFQTGKVDLTVTVLAQNWEQAREDLATANARIAELEEQVQRMVEDTKKAWIAEASAMARAEAAERSLVVAVDANESLVHSTERAESEAAALRADVAEQK